MDMYISSKNIHVAVPTSEFGYYARVRDQFSDIMNSKTKQALAS